MGSEEVDKHIEEINNDNKPIEKTEEIVDIKTVDVVTTAVEPTEPKETLGLKLISESSLSDEQKKLATNIYDSVKLAIKDFISDPSINNTIKITKVIGEIIKQLENANTNGKKILGSDKKAIVIQLGSILIKEVSPDLESEILKLYNLVAEQTLEAMIDVSKVVNVNIQEMSTKCCPGIMELVRKVLHK
jgi:hypothetical protein